MVGWRGNIRGICMQPPWGIHQETPRGRRRRSVHAGVRLHPGVASRDRLPHGGCMLGLDRFHMGFGLDLLGKWAFLHLLVLDLRYAFSYCAF